MCASLRKVNIKRCHHVINYFVVMAIKSPNMYLQNDKLVAARMTSSKYLKLRLIFFFSQEN